MRPTQLNTIVFTFLFYLLPSSNCTVAQSADWLWAKSTNGPGYNICQGTITDNNANVINTGIFLDTVDFDPGPGSFSLISQGLGDSFVCKLDQLGNFVWAKSFGNNQGDWAKGINVDEDDNIYISGYFSGTVDFDPGPGTYLMTSPSTTLNCYILKLNAAGQFVWAISIGDSQSLSDGMNIKVDSDNNIYILGIFSGTIDFDPGPGVFNLPPASGAPMTTKYFILKLDSAANFIWAIAPSGMLYYPGSTNFYALDPSGNSYVIGIFMNTFDFDPGPLVDNFVSNGYYDIFISKFDSFGNYLWTKQIGGTGEDVGSSIASDQGGNVYITGQFEDTVDFDPGIMVHNQISNGELDLFTAKLTPNGDLIWSHSFGDMYSEFGSATTADNSGNVYFSGFFLGTIDFDPGPATHFLNANNSKNQFVMKNDSAGNLIWVYDFPNLGSGSNVGLSIDPSGNGILAESFISDSISFGQHTVYNLNPQIQTMYVAKFSNTLTGISDIPANPSLAVYPNPTNGKLVIDLGSHLNAEIFIYDVVGRKIYSDQQRDGGLLYLDTDPFSPGIYFVNIKLPGIDFVEKIIFTSR